MFLESTPKQLTASQITSKFSSIQSSMQNAKNDFEFIKNWIVVSQDNTDYTDEDRQEVIVKLEELRTLAISLTE